MDYDSEFFFSFETVTGNVLAAKRKYVINIKFNES